MGLSCRSEARHYEAPTRSLNLIAVDRTRLLPLPPPRPAARQRLRCCSRAGTTTRCGCCSRVRQPLA